GACRLRLVHLPHPSGLRPGHADGGAVPARTRVGATRERATAPHLNAACAPAGSHPRKDIGAPAPPCGAPSASLPGLTISTYGLRRAPRIRSVLATTHHAPIIEIGSSRTDGGTCWLSGSASPCRSRAA